MKLIYAIALSMVLHVGILYTPLLQGLFSIEPLNWDEWKAVLLVSLPVILIDEVLKFLERTIYIQPAMRVPTGRKKQGRPEANGKVKAQ